MNLFNNDENGYEAWLEDNPNGFVFNHFAGNLAGYNKIHLVDCYTLHRLSDEGKRTVVEKICSNNLEELEERVRTLRNDSYSFCKLCIKPDKRDRFIVC